MKDDIDEAFEQYRDELTAEATLARADLDEIEDHFRALVDELRVHQPLGEAITAALLRLGEPRALAREHARVHGSFGPQLSAWRVWSVLVLLAPIFVSGLVMMPAQGLTSPFGIELMAGLVAAIALAARVGWARPVLFAGNAFWLVPILVTAYYHPRLEHLPLWLALHAGLLVFLAPWRRREITRAGVALALQTWSLGAAAFVLGYQITTRHGSMEYVTPSAQLAFVAAAVAVGGGIVRARWSALGSLVTSGALLVSIEELSHVTFHIATGYTATVFAMLATGALASGIAGVLLWRHARSTLGSLRDALAG